MIADISIAGDVVSLTTAVPDGVEATDELLTWHAASYVLAAVGEFIAGDALELLCEALARLEGPLDPVGTFGLGAIQLAELFDVGHILNECCGADGCLDNKKQAESLHARKGHGYALAESGS